MASSPARNSVVPVGIDLGTTYSCLSYLTPQGQPVTLANGEGELSTPSAVLFDGHDIIVGTEALRHSVASPERVVQHAKRHMGDPHKCWVFDGRVYRPKDIASFVVKKLLDAASAQLGTIRHAVITVPAQFSELQRRDTVEAGIQAGLERVDIINEPVAAAMCYVLGEGMWFAELANDQTVLVFDLGGGTFDLSLVQYNRQHVRVLASGGDLRLGGLDWNRALEDNACDLFTKESISDPRMDRESMQALALEVEQAKRSLSVRPRSSLVVQHAGRRKGYTIEREQFEALTKHLVDKTESLTQEMLKANKLGWARIDTVLATGGASRMPMIRNMLQRISGTTLNQALSPDQSICHGAAYYAGMLLSGRKLEKSVLNKQAATRLSTFKQQSVSGRSLGILVRDMQAGHRLPHFLLPANTPLPCAYQQKFGTAIPNQKKVHLHIIESGTSPDEPFVEIGECEITGLPENLPATSPIEVTIRYDEQARVHVEAVDITSGQRAETTIIRPASSTPVEGAATIQSAVQRPAIVSPADQFSMLPSGSAQAIPVQASPVGPKSPPPKAKAVAVKAEPERQRKLVTVRPAPISVEDSEMPVPLCNQCGEALDSKGRCLHCESAAANRKSGKSPARPGAAVNELQIKTEPMKSPPKAPQQRPRQK